MRGWPILLGVCIGVLAAALLFAQRWSSEEASEVVASAPTKTAASPTLEAVRHVEVTPLEPGADQSAALTAEAAEATQHEAPAPRATAPPMVPQLEQSPYLGDSRELTYAEQLLTEPRAAMNRVESAKGVFSRCLEAHPGNARCETGLTEANRLIGQARTGALQLTVDEPATDSARPTKSLQLVAPNTRIQKQKL